MTETRKWKVKVREKSKTGKIQETEKNNNNRWLCTNDKGRQGVEHVDDAMKGILPNIVLLLMKLKGLGVPSALLIQLHCKLLYLQMPQKNSSLSYYCIGDDCIRVSIYC